MGLNLFFVAAIAVLLPVFMAIFLARGVAAFDGAVIEVQQDVEQQQKGYNLAQTAGHRILPSADVNEQLQTARKLAAKRAASLPRGANMKIVPRSDGRLPSAQDGLTDDPLTAVKIAAFHGWQGAMQGAKVAAAAPVARRTGGAAGRAVPQRTLKPGVDYEWIEITDAMSPAEKRTARIANSKAKSAAVKAMKAAGGGAQPAMAEAQPAAAPAAPTTDSFEAAMVAVPEPDLIEITDDMDPADVRKARIANAKAQSAYKKALKAAGVNPTAGPAATSASPQAAVPAEPTPVTAHEPVAVPADIPAPELIEISDDMDPADIRRARIANAKAQSAYKKALKAAGIDPASV